MPPQRITLYDDPWNVKDLKEGIVASGFMDALEKAPHARHKTMDRTKHLDASADAVRQFTILDMPDLLPSMRRMVFAGSGCGLAAGSRAVT